MARLIMEGISLTTAKELAHWYEGQGEQDADIWLEEHGLRAPLADVGRKEGFMKVEGDDVTLYLKEYKDG